MSLINNIYEYKKIKRITDENGKRVYDTEDGNNLPSVTTILDSTSDKTAIYQWRKRIGLAEANHITKLSANIGTVFHDHMDAYLKGGTRPTGTTYVKQKGSDLADIAIEKIKPLTEVWGIEAPLYYPGLYAGTADLIGIWNGQPAILDFKNTRRPKKEQYLQNYYLQLTAYALAHNELFGSKINTGVILMISREDDHFGTFQEFTINILDYVEEWFKRVEHYYTNSNK